MLNTITITHKSLTSHILIKLTNLFLIVSASDRVLGRINDTPPIASRYRSLYLPRNVNLLQTSTKITPPSSCCKACKFLFPKVCLISSFISSLITESFTYSSSPVSDFCGFATLRSLKAEVSWSKISIPMSSLEWLGDSLVCVTAVSKYKKFKLLFWFAFCLNYLILNILYIRKCSIIPVSSIVKYTILYQTDCHNITEILLKVVSNIITLTIYLS